MKLVLCLLILTTGALAKRTPEQIAKLEPMSKECQAESLVTKEQIDKMRENGTGGDNPEMMKHMFCMMKKTGMMTESGDIKMDTMKAKLRKAGMDEDKMKEVEKCAIKKEKPEETARDLHRCIYDRMETFSPAD